MGFQTPPLWLYLAVASCSLSSDAACIDDLWEDFEGNTCRSYKNNNWCDSWRAVVLFDSQGITADDGCCECGGGIITECPAEDADCEGTCREDLISFYGDGVCDDGRYAEDTANLMCERWFSDAGDCGSYNVRITLVSAQTLPNTDTGTFIDRTSDPYATVTTGGETCKTQVVHNTLSPVWNQQCSFEQVQQGDEMMFEVWDDDAELDDSLGSLSIPFSGHSADYQYRLSSGGVLHVQVTVMDVGHPSLRAEHPLSLQSLQPLPWLSQQLTPTIVVLALVVLVMAVKMRKEVRRGPITYQAML